MTDPGEIDQDAARTVLIRSFSEEYRQYLNPDQVDRSLTKWTGSGASVEQYYKDYFATEFAEFSSGHLDVWIEARIGSKLVGWATFQLEKSDDPLKLDSAYMNLLIVDPAHQKLSIGKNLVYSIMRLGIMTDLDAINVLVRKTNQAGGRFYRSLGFQANPQYQRDNFVDLSLLEPISLDNPVLPEKEETRLRFR